jgi:hypothetical protein
MSTEQRQPAPPRKPGEKPFYFNRSEHLMRIGRERASTLSELLETLRQCPDDSIFQHTFRTLQEHHFIRQGLRRQMVEIVDEFLKQHCLPDALSAYAS